MKIWKRPELLILIRGKPEEAVLQSCKTMSGNDNLGPITDYISCSAALPACGAMCFDYKNTS
jgi:hypothetical protein